MTPELVEWTKETTEIKDLEEVAFLGMEQQLDIQK